MNSKTLSKRLNITENQAIQVLGVIDEQINPESFKSVNDWINQCYNMPSKLELKLCAINEIIEGFGVEYIEHINDGYGYDEIYGLDYVNLGDTYTNTVMFDYISNKWRFCSYGDIVESNIENYV